MKKFIMMCPLQPEGKLAKSVYVPQNNDKLEYGETRFPIIPVINGYAEEGEEVEIILIKSDNVNAELNEKYLREEVRELEERKEIKVKISIVNTPYNETIDTQINLFMDLIDKLKDNDDIYVCATYGTKPTPIVEMMAVNYAYRVLENASIGSIVYGQCDHDTERMEIFDITSLFYMDEMVNNLAKLRIKNPADRIRKLMNI